MGYWNQPQLLAGQSAMMTIGIVTNNDRTAIVMPMATDDPDVNFNQLCDNLVTDAATNLLPTLLDCLSADATVTHISAEGMLKGTIPMRSNLAGAVSVVGTRAAGAVSSQVAALLAFYANPDDIPAEARIRVAKTFVPGIADGDVTGDKISSNLSAALVLFQELLGQGFDKGGTGGYKWYRINGRPAGSPNASTTVVRNARGNVRDYVCTQRRRLTPRV